MLPLAPDLNDEPPPEDVEEELAAALPATQGRRFFPLMRQLVWHLVAFVLLGAAAYILWREFHDISAAEVAAAIRAWGWDSIVIAVGLSASSFLIMGFVEWMGLRWAGAQVPLPRALAGSFVASSIAHTLGANLIVSGAVRARFYARHGITLRQVAAATLFHGFSFTVGIATLAGLAFLLAGSRELTAVSRIPTSVADSAGVILITGVLGYVVLCAVLHRPLRAFGHSVRLPSWRVAIAQICIGATDNAVAAAILWVLLPDGAIGYFTFVGAYAPSVVVGLVSHVPGGMGVFEGSISTLIKGVHPAALAAAFLGYRVFFFLLPLLIGSLSLAVDTLREQARRSR
ncbi:MAG: hypothetical protein DI570_08505 [Phenylobacterium zucineum]|nr:MAG: hypothetical protein DI570_08505 [Phenylobacterium zucineum]